MQNSDQFLVAREVFRLPPAAAGDPFNFINEGTDFFVRWCQAYPVPKHGSPAYACLVGCERLTEVLIAKSGCEERKHFRDDTPSDLLGGVYFCSYTMARVFSLAMELKSLHDCESALKKVGLEDYPVLFFNAAKRCISWRMNKNEDFRSFVVRNAEITKLTSSRFDEILLEFHQNYTETPQGLTRPWLDAPKFLTKSHLEEEIRDDLFIFLRHLSPEPIGVQREFYNSAGRTDLLVYFFEEKLTYYIELKVLRSWRSNGKSRRRATSSEGGAEWGKKGIVQAFSYTRLSSTTGCGFACCFDARETDEEIEELVEFAKVKSIQYRRYFMYSSASALQAKLMS